MYDIALSVAACARSSTRADVAWMLEPAASDEALAFTPGGGRIGVLRNGAFDGLLADAAARQLPSGRLVRHVVTDLESQVSGIPTGTQATFLVVPAEQFPDGTWPRLLDRQEVTFTIRVADSVVESMSLGAESQEAEEGVLIARIVPVPRLVVAGQGPIAEALAAQGNLLGWKVAMDSRPSMVAGLTATLSAMDAVVVMGHDVEASSSCLMAALDSDAGYIGALGSRAMQQTRADWLAMRDVTDTGRVHGPAGLDIGASSPAQIAVSIAAEIIAATRS